MAVAEAQTSTIRVSVVIPCLNEAETIEECVRTARSVLEEQALAGEVIVVDNGSGDGSGELARGAGATVIWEPRQGYGSAYLAGLAAARGDYIVMVDADLTYDFREISRFVHELEDGAQLVVGNRMGSIRPGAMPWLNRYVGNPLLSGFLNLLFRTKVRDVHCGMRALRREVLPALDLRTTGMEFASEMVIRASRQRLDVREFPIELHPRAGQSKLSPLRDGWRHLRLTVVYSPNFLFVLPGTLMILLGVAAIVTVFAHGALFGRGFFLHTLIAGCLLTIVGVQAIGLGLCARAYGVYFMGERDQLFERLRRRFRLEHGLLLAVACVAGALAGFGVILERWADRGFGTLGEERLAIVVASLFVIGVQVFFTSFLLSILGLRWRGRETAD
jgi:glycosyltransferase involved in cell wall biosynthesis